MQEQLHVRHINDYSHAQIVSRICGHETTVIAHALLAQARPTMPCICLVILREEKIDGL